jgi:porphobilinogen synthase
MLDMTTESIVSDRPRRLRRSPGVRRLVRENTLTVDNFIYPMFIVEGQGIERPIDPMPGHFQRSVDRLDAELDALIARKINAVLLFGVPEKKDAEGSSAWDPSGPVPQAIEFIKRRVPDMVVIADVCLCEYTDHGHCGLIHPETGDVVNDTTLPLLAKAAVAYANAGADIVAPSAMMDGQVAEIRSALDEAGHHNVAIMSYSAKYASGFYGPFRAAAGSTPQFGDRRAYQMDPPNAREAMREVELDVMEGADIVMVKPAGVYLDILRQIRDRVELPVAAYQVSGEYAMLKAAAQRGWLDERRTALESLMAIKRSGADLIITYYAKEAADWLLEAE